MLPVRVERRAQHEIEEAHLWWIENRPEAGTTLGEELLDAYDRIAMQPRVGAVADDRTLGSVRRLLLIRTRYYLYYRLAEDCSTVVVLALWHTSRGTIPNI